MSVTKVAIAVITALLGLLCYRIFFHPLAKIPGPFLAKITGHWRNKRVWRGTWHDDILELHERYGRVVRIAPSEVAVVDQNAMKQLYGHGHNAEKTEWYATWDAGTGEPAFFTVRDRKLHSFLRKRVSSAFSMTAILKYERSIQELLDLMIQKLRKHAEAGNVVDLDAWTGAFAFDVVGELGYGAPLGHLEKDAEDVMNTRSNVLQLFFLSNCMGHYRYLGQMRLFRSVVTQKIIALLGKRNGLVEFRDWSVARVQERFEQKEKELEHADMLAHFMKMKNANGGPASFSEVLSESLNLVGAGADTTSIAMRACIEALCLRPDMYTRLQAEVDDFYTTNRLTEPITYMQTQQLVYLNAIAKEAMRLHPSIVAQLLRHTPQEGLTNRDKAIWGEDANEFRPERWLEDEAKARYLESNNMTFGGNGPRMCIGRNIALVEVHKFLAQMIRHFDIEIVNNEQPNCKISYWFCYQQDFMVRLKSRYHEGSGIQG